MYSGGCLNVQPKARQNDVNVLPLIYFTRNKNTVIMTLMN